MRTTLRIKPFIFFACLFMCVSLACGSSTPTPSASNESGQQNQISPTQEIKPTNTSKPENTPTTLPIGLGRYQPFPRSEVVSAPNWDVQILETKRGEEAWVDIQNANQFNDPAPEGMEYLLVNLHVKSTYADNEEHSITYCDFDVTGDKKILYTCSMSSVVTPEPQLDATLYTGGEAEGWAGYLVGVGEGNLILIVDESWSFEEDAKRYIALDDGASISVPDDLLSISPSDIGKDRLDPAPKNEILITDGWEIAVLESIRGAEALVKVQEGNMFNDPPDAGMEYIVERIHVRYIGTEDKSVNISSSDFKSTGSANTVYDNPYVVSPEPSLDITLYPGGEYEGWVVVQAAEGETGVSLVFDPLWDFSGDSKRYISLD